MLRKAAVVLSAAVLLAGCSSGSESEDAEPTDVVTTEPDMVDSDEPTDADDGATADGPRDPVEVLEKIPDWDTSGSTVETDAAGNKYASCTDHPDFAEVTAWTYPGDPDSYASEPLETTDTVRYLVGRDFAVALKSPTNDGFDYDDLAWKVESDYRAPVGEENYQ